MQCPTCVDTVLVMADRQGVEIDYCPRCRGVWLDRGELDKLIERAGVQSAPAPAMASPAAQPLRQDRRPDFVGSDYRHGHGKGHYRKKSWLSDIFD